MKKVNKQPGQIKRNEDLMRIATYVILFITTLIFLLSQPVARGSFSFYGTILLLTAVLLLNIFSNDLEKYIGSEPKAQLIFLITSSVLILLAALVGKFYNIIFLLFMLAAQTYMMLKFKAATILMSFVLALYILILRLLGLPGSGILDLSLSLVVGMVFVITLSLVLVRYAEQTERAESLNKQLILANEKLITAQQKEKELAAAEERVRLARDIHDGLGHHLTTLSIQLQAAEKLITTKPEKAVEAIQISREETKAALEEVRHSVAVMRRHPLDGKTLVQAIQQLINDYQRTAESKIEFNHTGLQSNLDPKISNTLYRCVQEGLTNIQKHTINTSLIKITLLQDMEHIELTIQDNGLESSSEEIKSGFGLSGLRERIEQLGGHLTASPIDPQGFKLTVFINFSGGHND